MPDDDQPDAPEDSPEEPAAPKDEPFDEDRAKAKIAKANSEAANLRKRMKELESKAARLDELEDASKSEQERLAEQSKTLESRATKAEQDAARLRVAINKGLTITQAKRLVGETEEELEADAEELLASFKAPDDRPAGRPREALRGGSEPDDEPEEADPRKLAAQVPRNRF